MRILLVSEVYPPQSGGAGWSARSLALGLRDAGHEVRVLTSASGAQRDDGVQEIRISEPRSLWRRRATPQAFAAAIEKEDASFRADVIHAQHSLAALGATAVAPHKTVITVRDHWPVCFWSTRLSRGVTCPRCSALNKVRCLDGRVSIAAAPVAVPYMTWDLGAKRTALNKAKAVIAVSEAIATELREAGIHRVTPLPNIVSEGEIAPIAAQAPSPSLEVPARFLLFVGKLEPNKGVRDLVRAVALSHAELPLVVLGSGSEEDAMRRDAQEKGVDLRLPGWAQRSDVLRLMSRAEALVFPSSWEEPLSRVLLEALALGVPIAAVDTGGTKELIEDGRSGLLAKDAASLGAALSRIVGDAELRGKLKAGARERARRFSPEVLIPRYESLYRGIA